MVLVHDQVYAALTSSSQPLLIHAMSMNGARALTLLMQHADHASSPVPSRLRGVIWDCAPMHVTAPAADESLLERGRGNARAALPGLVPRDRAGEPELELALRDAFAAGYVGRVCEDVCLTGDARHWKSASADIAATFAWCTEHWHNVADKYGVRQLVLYSDADELFSTEMVENASQTLGTCRQLQLIHGAPHCALLRHNPLKFASVVDGWLSKTLTSHARL